MNVRTDFPRQIREIENMWITLSDKTRLAARLWLPVDAAENPVPALLEYIPYRKNDRTAIRDSLRHPYLAGHGYACIRVDMRGSGESDGILYDEYLPREQDDALEVLAWVAEQPWCTGDVGIFGKSWGGFNGLQIAARRPPELKAIISIYSTDDRYADDVHYMGGCMLGSKMLYWASTMLELNARPPDPRHVGEKWREMWMERLEKSPPFVETWLAHQHRDDYWKQGSVCEDFSAITCPVYAVGGWADAYTNAVFRLLEGLTCPRKGLIGPWGHEYPEVASPGPAVGFLQESLRWWDTWLKGIDTGMMEEPMLRVWMQDAVPPALDYPERPGRWVGESSWPSSNITGHTYVLNTGYPEGQLRFRGLQTTGVDAGEWMGYGIPGEDSPPDQRAEDGRSLTFTSAPVEAPMEILGFPEVALELASDRPQALLAVRLCDVAPSGASTLVSRGVLNLTHLGNHEHPVTLTPGQRFSVKVRLNAIAYALPEGHRWRVGVSPTYWPQAWPSPEPVTLTLFSACRLVLPVRPQIESAESLSAFGPPEVAPRLDVEVLREGARRRIVSQDGGRCEVEIRADGGRVRFKDSGLEHESVAREQYAIREGDPLSARVRCKRTAEFQRGDWHTRIETDSRMWSDRTHFYVTNHLVAYEGEEVVFDRTWRFDVGRDGV